jgi:hypothetical protein
MKGVKECGNVMVNSMVETRTGLIEDDILFHREFGCRGYDFIPELKLED